MFDGDKFDIFRAGAEDDTTAALFAKSSQQVRFQWKKTDFLFKNPDLLLKNLGFLLKNVEFILKNTGEELHHGDTGAAGRRECGRERGDQAARAARDRTAGGRGRATSDLGEDEQAGGGAGAACEAQPAEALHEVGCSAGG